MDEDIRAKRLIDYSQRKKKRKSEIDWCYYLKWLGYPILGACIYFGLFYAIKAINGVTGWEDKGFLLFSLSFILGMILISIPIIILAKPVGILLEKASYKIKQLEYNRVEKANKKVEEYNRFVWEQLGLEGHANFEDW